MSHLLRNHYRSYKREWEALGYRDFAGTTSVSQGITAQPGRPFNFTFGATGGIYNNFGNYVRLGNYTATCANFNGKSASGYAGTYGHVEAPYFAGASPGSSGPKYHRQAAGNIVPVVTRFTVAFGLSTSNNGTRTAITMDPYMTIWNPYNQKLTFNSIGCYFTKFHRINFKITNANNLTQNVQFTDIYIGGGAYHFALPAARYTLEPGELKLIGPSNSTLQTVAGNQINHIQGQIGYNENSNIQLIVNNVPPVGPAQVEITGLGGENMIVDVFMLYSKGPGGESRNPVTMGVSTGSGGVNPPERATIDESHVQRLACNMANSNADSFSSNSLVKTGVPIPANTSKAIFAALDFRQDNTGGAVAGDGNPNLATRDSSPFMLFNPRAQSVALADYGRGDMFTPNWSRKILNINSTTDLQLGSFSGPAYWGGGNDAGSGESRVAMFEIPQVPLTSIGSLMHADCGFISSHPTYVIGNSFAPPAFAASNLGSLFVAPNRPGSIPTVVQPQFDLSWAANETLWDRYFFSGANYGDGSPNTNLDEVANSLAQGNVSKLADQRFTLAESTDDAATLRAKLKDYKKIASRLAYEGGFNVNSTSVEAWSAVLASLNNQESEQGKAANPLTRWSHPVGNTTERWTGYKSLSDTEIRKLAVEIVKQVKERGPFMSMGDFVNRRLVTNETLGGKGALQAAIDLADLADAGPTATGPGSTVSLRTKGREAGISRSLVQPDILAAIGPSLFVRGDTFVIRAYGEAQENGIVTAQAWCEAVVQRTTEGIVDVSTLDETIPQTSYPAAAGSGVSGGPGSPALLPLPQFVKNTTLPAAYSKFGRKFRVQSFRWLNSKEI